MAKDRTITQEIILLVLEFAVVMLVLAVVVNWLYPVAYESEIARYSTGMWLVGYSLSILALSVFVIALSQLCYNKLHERPVLGAFCAGAATFLVILLYSIAVIKSGPSGVGVDLIDVMNAKYFGEWQFLKFDGVIAPTCALLSAGLTWIKSYLNAHW